MNRCPTPGHPATVRNESLVVSWIVCQAGEKFRRTAEEVARVLVARPDARSASGLHFSAVRLSVDMRPSDPLAYAVASWSIHLVQGEDACALSMDIRTPVTPATASELLYKRLEELEHEGWRMTPDEPQRWLDVLPKDADVARRVLAKTVARDARAQANATRGDW